jgi:hypothetical protein
MKNEKTIRFSVDTKREIESSSLCQTKPLTYLIMKKLYSYTVSMLGYEDVKGTHEATRSHDAEMAGLKHFMAHNAIEKGEDETWSELIRFYAPEVTVSREH